MRSLHFLVAIVALTGPAVAAGETPLFSSSEPVAITISGPVSEIVRKAASSTEPHPATLSYAGESHAIDLSARGNARRRPEVCKFPPLRVKFAAKPADGSLFEKQKSLKLVTHCRAAASFQQTTLLEYAAYGMFNALAEESFRVRLAKVRYVDEPSGKLVAERLGFFIEDADDLADRVGMKEVEAGKLSLGQHDPQAAARAVLFFHMIANHDFSMLAGPDGECCHNGKLLGPAKDASEGLVYVPYDFDYSGFVGAPYAIPPDEIKIKSVKARYWRGDCAQNDAVRKEAARFRDRRDAIEAAVRATPEMTKKTADQAVKFLDGFFKEIENDAGVEKLLKKCR
jgi:hypothetical protein